MSASAEPSLVEGSKPEQPPKAPDVHPEVLGAQAQDILTVLLVFRFINALCLRTFFQPDEYFQALEPAWDFAFGQRSGAWLTWEWRHQLRSSLGPVLFGSLYLLLDKTMSVFAPFPPFKVLFLTFMPKAVQAVFAALADYYTWKFAEKIYGQGSNTAWSAFWMTILNPWLWYCSTRTFSNSIETTLTIAALYYWPWGLLGVSKDAKSNVMKEKGTIRKLRVSLILAAIAVLLRPTNILIWIAILTLTFTRLSLDGTSPLTKDELVVLTREIIICGTSTLTLSVVFDRLYFRFWTFPPYTWLHFNISQSLAVFYGRMPWHYYISQGIPLLTTTFLPFAVLGLFKTPSIPTSTSTVGSNTVKTLVFVVFTMVGTLSFISHKEVRFIYPLLPILHVVAAPYISSFFTSNDTQSPPADKPQPPSTVLRHKFFLANIISLNLLLAAYLSLFHQAAPIAVVNFLRYEFERTYPDRLDLHSRPLSAVLGLKSVRGTTGSLGGWEGGWNDDPLFALFLTPCHSTPWRSHLVYPRLRAHALTCEPPLHTVAGSTQRAEYVDEADRFYAKDAEGLYGGEFLGTELWPRAADGKGRMGEVPRFIVGFEGVEVVLERFFEGEGKDLGVRLTRKWEGFNGLFNEDWRRRGKLIVWDTGISAQDPR